MSLFSRVFWIGVIMSLVMSLCGLQIYQLYRNWLSIVVERYWRWITISMAYGTFQAITFCGNIYDFIETEDVINLLCNKFELYKNVTLKWLIQ